MEALQRLRTRASDDDDTIARRFGNAKREIEHYLLFDYVIVNDDLEDAKERLRGIVVANCHAASACRWPPRSCCVARRKVDAFHNGRARDPRSRSRTSDFPRRSLRFATLLVLEVAALLLAPRLHAQIESNGQPLDPARPLLLAVDADDDDEDGVIDGQQADHVPTEELAEVVIQPSGTSDATIAALGGLRVIRHGQVLNMPLTLAAADLPASLQLQATRPSLGGHPVALLVTQNGQTQRINVQTVELTLLGPTTSRSTRRATRSRSRTTSRTITRYRAAATTTGTATTRRTCASRCWMPPRRACAWNARLEAVSGDGGRVARHARALARADRASTCRSARVSCAWWVTTSTPTRAASPVKCCA